MKVAVWLSVFVCLSKCLSFYMSVSVSQTEPGEFWTRGAEAGAQTCTLPHSTSCTHPQNGLHSLYPISVSVYEACVVNHHTCSIVLPSHSLCCCYAACGFICYLNNLKSYWCVRCYMFCCVLFSVYMNQLYLEKKMVWKWFQSITWAEFKDRVGWIGNIINNQLSERPFLCFQVFWSWRHLTQYH